jgi:hypothetical protein
MKQYLLLMRGGKPAASKTEEESKAENAAWGVYMGSMVQNGNMAGGAPLVGGGKSVSASGITNEAVTSSPEGIVGGYLIINAESLEAAAALADACPHKNYHGHIEVREIAPMPAM